MTREELKQIIPHREPMLLIDEVILDDGKAIGTYHVRGDEFFLQGHFPCNPILPGVIQCEMAAQTCAVLFTEQIKGKTPLFTGINNVKFKNPIKPGDTIKFICEIDRIKEPFYFTKGKAYVGEKLCMSGEFSFAAVGGI